MSLKLFISLALCQVAWGRPRDDADEGLREAISNLQLLIPVLLENSLAELQPSQEPGPSPPAQRSQPARAREQSAYLAPPASPAPSASPPSSSLKVYSPEGPFSDIPAEAFTMEHRKELKRVNKKDLSHPHDRDLHRGVLGLPGALEPRVAADILETCLSYYQGRSRAQPDSLELILDICNELLDASDIDYFAIDQKPQLENQGDFRALDDRDHHHHHHLGADGSLKCDCSAAAHGDAKAGARAAPEPDDNNAHNLLTDLLELFKPVGHRTDWKVVNSQNSHNHP